MNSRDGFVSRALEDHTLFMAIYPVVRRIAGVRSARAFSKFSTRTVDREDLQQEALIAIWRVLPRYDPSRASVRTFLERIAGARIASLVRTERLQPRFESIQIDQILAPDSISALELRTDLRCVSASLSERDRELALALMDHSCRPRRAVGDWPLAVDGICRNQSHPNCLCAGWAWAWHELSTMTDCAQRSLSAGDDHRAGRRRWHAAFIGIEGPKTKRAARDLQCRV